MSEKQAKARSRFLRLHLVRDKYFHRINQGQSHRASNWTILFRRAETISKCLTRRNKGAEVGQKEKSHRLVRSLYSTR